MAYLSRRWRGRRAGLVGGLSLLGLAAACGHTSTAPPPVFVCPSRGQRPPTVVSTITTPPPALPFDAALRRAYQLTNSWHGMVWMGQTQAEVYLVAGAPRPHPSHAVVLTIERVWRADGCHTRWFGPLVTRLPAGLTGSVRIVRVVPSDRTVWVQSPGAPRTRQVPFALGGVGAGSIEPGPAWPSWLPQWVSQLF